MTCGIYILKFKDTDKVYIGQSVNIDKRKSTHYRQFKNGTHSKKLQDAYKLYGLPSLEIIMESTLDTLDILENEAIQIWNSVENGFNTLKLANDSPTYNVRGEQHCNSIYSNEQIEKAFLLICKKQLTLKEISECTDIKYGSIRTIANGNQHTWLKDKYPIEYNLMLDSINNRVVLETGYSGMAKYSRQQIEDAFLLLMEGTLSRKGIASITETNYRVVSNIADGNAYSWLSKLHPEKYALLLSTKRPYAQK